MTKDKKNLIREEIKEYLNRDRELQPKEERLIKKVTKRYNIFIGIFAVIGILVSIGVISIWKSIAVEKESISAEKKSISVEKAIQTAVKDAKNEMQEAIESTRKDIQELEKKAGRQLAVALEDARSETNNYKNFAIESMTTLNDRFIDISEDVFDKAAGVKQLTDELIELRNVSAKIENSLKDKLKKSEEMSTTLNGLLEELEEESELVKKYEDLFGILRSKDSNQLVFRTYVDNKQCSFGIGELLIVFGRGKNDRKGNWVKVDFGEQKFNSNNEMFLSVTGIDKNDNSYAIVKCVTQAGFSCKFLRKISGLGGYHKVGNARFNHMAIGKAAPAKSPEAEKGHE